ncbi:unnamed protein product, partial [Nippostrongylus brasiliensis]|uniref:Reverse transcriptase domain-containing protein n=1 Tax=Nippostrongylus brasiliensis TaxID=27835 RepID=A0A0N4Y744_NIPBR
PAVYLDDGLIWADSVQSCQDSVNLIRSDLYDADLRMIEEKCSWHPSLGITLGKRLLETRGPSIRERLKRKGYIASVHLVLSSHLKRTQ